MSFSLDQCQIMEVDSFEGFPAPDPIAIPNMDCFSKPDIKQEVHWQPDPDPFLSSPHINEGGISLLKRRSNDHISTIKLTSHQPTKEPEICPETPGLESESMPMGSFPQEDAYVNHASVDMDDDTEIVDAPGLEGFDDLPDVFPSLSARDVEEVLRVSTSPESEMPMAPTVPDIQESGTIYLIPEGSRPEALDAIPAQRWWRRRESSSACIKLLPAQSPSAASEQSAADRDMIHELMAEKDCGDSSSQSGACAYHAAGLQLGTSVDARDPRQGGETPQREHLVTAEYLLELHQSMTLEIPQSKKKPMLHEFLGYILFRGTDPGLSVLRDSVYFCSEDGQRVVPPLHKDFFRVVKFPLISEVWRLIKCNSSKDCAKNMKRAMRMSTTNERGYFDGLDQRMHRNQVFKFGVKSMECFRRMFPHWFSLA